jgi:hypothetical protein
MMPFEMLGIQRIQRLSQSARAACSFQNLLVIQPQPAFTFDLVCSVQVAIAGDVLDNVRDIYAMGVECSLGEQLVEVDAAYDSKIISHKQMQRVMSQFSYLVQQLLQTNETYLVGDLDMLGPNGREEIESWNAGSLLLESSELCLDGMFEASIHRNGGKVAVEAWDGNFTYKALDQTANCLAQHLVNIGVGPEVKVPLCFQKSK